MDVVDRDANMVGQERKMADKVDGCRGQRREHGGTGKKDGGQGGWMPWTETRTWWDRKERWRTRWMDAVDRDANMVGQERKMADKVDGCRGQGREHGGTGKKDGGQGGWMPWTGTRTWWDRKERWRTRWMDAVDRDANMVGQERKMADKVDGCRGQRREHGGTGNKDGGQGGWMPWTETRTWWDRKERWRTRWMDAVDRDANMVGQERKMADKVDGCRGQRREHGGTGNKDGGQGGWMPWTETRTWWDRKERWRTRWMDAVDRDANMVGQERKMADKVDGCRGQRLEHGGTGKKDGGQGGWMP